MNGALGVCSADCLVGEPQTPPGKCTMTASADCIMVWKTWTGQGQKSSREHPAWCLVSAQSWPEPRAALVHTLIRGLGAL